MDPTTPAEAENGQVAPGAAISVDAGKVDRRRAARAARARAAVRRERVAELRIAGATIRQVAAEVGVAKSMVEKDWRRWLEDNKPDAESRDQYRRIQQERYQERLLCLRTLRQKAVKAEPVPFGEISRLVAVENDTEAGLRRLLGTDAPIVVQHEGTIGVEVDGRIEALDTPEHWARMLELKSLQESVRKLLPAGLLDQRPAAIDVTAVAAGHNGNGHNGNGNGGTP